MLRRLALLVLLAIGLAGGAHAGNFDNRPGSGGGGCPSISGSACCWMDFSSSDTACSAPVQIVAGRIYVAFDADTATAGYTGSSSVRIFTSNDFGTNATSYLLDLPPADGVIDDLVLDGSAGRSGVYSLEAERLYACPVTTATAARLMVCGRD